MQILLLLIGHCGPVLHYWGTWRCRDDRWACPLSDVTFDPHQALPGAWQVKGEAMAVNEAEYISVIVWTVGLEDRQRRCEVSVVVRRWCCSAHTGNEVSSCVGGVAEWLWRSCMHFGLVEGVWFLWDCELPVASQHFVGPWGTGWCCCGCGQAPPFRPSFRSFENIKWTLPALAATPLWHR